MKAAAKNAALYLAPSLGIALTRTQGEPIPGLTPKDAVVLWDIHVLENTIEGVA